ncbi:hypothetical protein [Maridesulfovibrio sp.]|uniref:hypothetical protein n=1 Tax=Maridesulfovibrio sp. TaxID=2795000 RepID=UPI002A18BE64|nr:hypothetical protein [Maridesulfovibrio sp.]
MADNFSETFAGGMSLKSGGDVVQMQGVGSYMGDMTDNSNEGWGADGDQKSHGNQTGTGGDATDNVDIGSINISS